MKHGRVYTVGPILLIMVAFATSPAQAQTLSPLIQQAPTPKPVPTAPGPYYAPPSWDQKLPSFSRFIVLSDWGNAAVLDKETGLVWERSPSQTLNYWVNASFHCLNKVVGDRKGWRLPTIQELASLIDMSVTSIPKLPTGHPFLITTPYLNNIWSATSSAERPDSAYIATSHGQLLAQGKNGTHGIPWCVRGGSGVDLQ